MFEWLKFWSSRMEVFAVVLIPGIMALLFFLIPFLDRKLERRPWRRPIPLLAVAIVLVGIIFLGFKSHLDDLRDQASRPNLHSRKNRPRTIPRPHSIPAWNPPAGHLSSAPVGPLVAKGMEILDSKGSLDARGRWYGNGAAPSLVGITTNIPPPQLTNASHHPNAKMLAGHMPSFELVHVGNGGPFQLSGQSGK